MQRTVAFRPRSERRHACQAPPAACSNRPMNERLAKADRRPDRRPRRADRRPDPLPDRQPARRRLPPCAEYLGARLKKRGFGIEFVRGEGAPGDTDRYPAHQRDRPFRRPRPRRHGAFQLAYRRGRGRRRLERRPVRRHRPRRPRLWPRRLRHEGRARRLDHRGRSLHGGLSGFSRRHRDFRHGRRGIRRFRRRRLPGAARAISRSPASTTSSFPSRSTRTASALAIAASGGRRSRPRARSRMARCRSSATAPCATWARCWTPSSTSCSRRSTGSRRACRWCRRARGARP